MPTGCNTLTGERSRQTHEHPSRPRRHSTARQKRTRHGAANHHQRWSITRCAYHGAQSPNYEQVERGRAAHLRPQEGRLYSPRHDRRQRTDIVGEGVETTVSAMQISGVQGVAAIDAGNFASVNLPPCSELIIARDRGRVGREAGGDTGSALRCATDRADRRTAEGLCRLERCPPGGAEG